MQDFFKIVNNKYNELLQQMDKKDVEMALSFFNIKKDLLTDNTHIEDGFLVSDIEKKSEKVLNLKKEYEAELKKIFIKNNGLLSHITNISPEKLKGGKINKSHNQLNNYMTEIGDWVFASSSLVDGNNTYIARKAPDGMVNITYTSIIYGGDNFEVVKNDLGENRIYLKEPNYVYFFKPDKFTPVTTVMYDRRTRLPRFDFSEEWTITEDVSLDNKDIFVRCEEVKDITSLFEWRQIFCDPKIRSIKKPIAYKIRSISPENRLDEIAKYVANGNLIYINQLAEINVNSKLIELINKYKNIK